MYIVHVYIVKCFVKVDVFTRSAVASDAGPCAGVGKDVLEDGGKAVDAAIAALLCMGVYHPQSSGVGGGFVMTLFSSENQTSEVLVARERAPSYSTQECAHQILRKHLSNILLK